MKKFLSIFLALTLMIGLIPTAFADDTTTELTSVTYTFNNSQHGESSASYLEDDGGNKKLTAYSTSGGEWAYLGTTSTTLYNDANFASLTEERTYFNFSQDSFATFKIKVPIDGNYEVSKVMAHLWRDKNTGAARDVEVYIIPMTDSLNVNSTVWGTVSNRERSGAPSLDSLITISSLGTLNYSVTDKAVPGNIDVSTFSTINMEADTEYALIFYSEGGGYFGPQSLTLTKQFSESETTPEAAPDEVTYGVFVNDVNCASAVTANGTKLSNTTYGFATGTLTPGANLTATAEDNVSGYKFRYWVLGSAATGRYYSSDNTVTVNPYANIALTAIYTAVEQEKEYIDFFNWNGDYVDSKEITDGKISALPTATLTGYEFAHWLLEDNVTKLTSANYEEIDIPVGVSKAMAQYTALNDYDSSNKPEETSATGWTRGGKHVSYSETYEFFKWLNDVGEIAPYNGETIIDKIPLAVLESYGNNYMLEYDKGDYTIVEAGILFGNDAGVDVKSAYSKATVKNIKPHGQFTATLMENATAGMQSYARGYVMYEDTTTGDIKVIYAE